MSDGHPGWFKDPSDPTLARWHDGNDWTEHTLVIADQAPGVEPAPPVITPPDETSAADTYFPRHTTGVVAAGATAGTTSTDEGGGVPGWAKVLIPVVVVLAGVLGFSLLAGGGDDDDPDEAATVDTQPASLDDAVEAARDAGLPSAVSDATAASLITRICSAAERPSSVAALGEDLGELPVGSASELRTAINALGEGAEDRCPSELADAPDLIDDLQDQAFVAFSTTTTAPTVPGSVVPGEGEATDGGDEGEGTTGGRTSTTRRTTGTTRPTSTTQPPSTTTTRTDIQQGFRCSSPGQTAIDKFGKSVTCQVCPPSRNATWRTGPCPTTPTAPPPQPTQPTTPTSAPATTAP